MDKKTQKAPPRGLNVTGLSSPAPFVGGKAKLEAWEMRDKTSREEDSSPRS